MDIKEHLTKLKIKIDKELESFFNYKLKQSRKEKKPKEYFKMVENIKIFTLSSGKRLRPILFLCGYSLINRKKDINKILKAAISIELIHSYFLIHDDIIDRDDFRHGGPSMHRREENEYRSYFRKRNLKHFGTSMAIMAGDLASVFGYEILASSDFSSKLKIKAIQKLNQIVSNTAAGEIMDVVLEMDLKTNAGCIIEMQKYKTAMYTIEGPLHLGAILAGADEKFLQSLSKFAVPLGIAYQIQDDIIGVFGNEKEIGKPVGSDIREGKRTLLISDALKRADEKQKKILNSILGNRKIGAGDIDKARKVIMDTGSLELSNKKAEKLAKLSKKHIEKIEGNEEEKVFLKQLADFVVKRRF